MHRVDREVVGDEFLANPERAVETATASDTGGSAAPPYGLSSTLEGTGDATGNLVDLLNEVFVRSARRDGAVARRYPAGSRLDRRHPPDESPDRHSGTERRNLFGPGVPGGHDGESHHRVTRHRHG